MQKLTLQERFQARCGPAQQAENQTAVRRAGTECRSKTFSTGKYSADGIWHIGPKAQGKKNCKRS